MSVYHGCGRRPMRSGLESGRAQLKADWAGEPLGCR
jgi:hypothetical protein